MSLTVARDGVAGCLANKDCRIKNIHHYSLTHTLHLIDGSSLNHTKADLLKEFQPNLIDLLNFYIITTAYKPAAS